MADRLRVVFCTNVLINRLLAPASTPSQAIALALESGRLLMSVAACGELSNVLSRPKFDTYLTTEDRQTFFLLLGRVSEFVEISETVEPCRDPRDDKFLELAFAGQAL